MSDRCGRVPASTLVLLLILTAGCGGPALHPVEGKVVYADDSDAVQLAGGTVEFESKEQKVSARGTIGPDATFRLTTHQPNDGVPPGRYQVLVRPPFHNPDRGAPPPLVAARFGRYETSGLDFTVEPGKNRAVLKVERPRPSDQ